MRLFEIIRQNLEQKRLLHEAEIEREKERIQKLSNSPIPWDFVIELEREEENTRGKLCSLKKYVMCNVRRKEVWDSEEIEGVVISGDDFGKQMILEVKLDFYGRNRLRFWDTYDYVWYSYGKQPELANQSFATVAQLNEYINLYNKNLIEGKSKSNINTQLNKIV